MQEVDTPDGNRNDLVWGARAIGSVINRETRQTFGLLESKQLPAKKVGGRWVASRQRLLNHLAGEAA